jgi:TonB family protein
LKTFAFLLFLAVLSFAQNRPDARDLLSRADMAIFTAKTVRLAASQSHGFVGSPFLGSPFKIEFIRGGKGRAEYRYPVGDGTITLMVFDGVYLWEYHSLGNQYTKNPESAWKFEGEIATLDYGRRSANILKATYQDDEMVDFRGHPVDCYVVLANYGHAPPSLTVSRTAIRRVWISKDSELILRDYWEGTDGFGGANRTVTTQYTDIATDIPLSDDLFVFQPPPASKVAPPVVLGGVVGGVVGGLPPVPGMLRTKVDPEYSTEARAAGLQGSVIVSFEISSDGHPQNPRIVHALGMGLDQKAIDAVSQWRYNSDPNPTLALSRRVVEVPFHLKPAGPWGLSASVFSAGGNGEIADTSKPELLQYAAPDPGVCSAPGFVAADFNIGSDGAPSDIQIATNTTGVARQALLSAFQSWRFRPAASKGTSIPGRARVLLACYPGGAFIPTGPIYSETVVVPPSLLFKVEPEYTEEARKAKLQGQVTIDLTVEPDGTVAGLQTRRRLGMGLDDQATGAVLQWRFNPGTKDGKPVRVRTQVKVGFALP